MMSLHHSRTGFSLKNRFEEYRGTLYNDVVAGLCDVRKAALQVGKYALRQVAC